jgi:hypothetical protein
VTHRFFRSLWHDDQDRVRAVFIVSSMIVCALMIIAVLAPWFGLLWLLDLIRDLIRERK